jgi:putative transposase
VNYTATQIAAALGVSKQAVSYRSRKESWPSQKRKGKGGGKTFPMSSLPEDVRTAMVTQTARGAVASEECTALELAKTAPVAKRSLVPAVSKMAQPITLDIPRKKKALAKADLVRYYTEALAKALNKEQARIGFMHAYKARAWQDLYAQIGDVSWKSIERWKVQLDRSRDAFLLADKRGLALKGECSLTEDMQLAVLRLALHPNRVRISTCITMAREMLTATTLEPVPSAATFRRFLTKFESVNRDVWIFCREGVKAWNDKVAMYVDRNLWALQVGDILVADGHRLNFQTIHPETGKPCRMTVVVWYDMASNFALGWEVAPEENIQVIAAAMRRALLRLGKTARIAYLDNGRAFKGTHFTGTLEQSGIAGLFQRIGLQTIFAWAYHGQSKTVERFFGYLRQMEELMPCGTGASIEMKPAYQKRGEFMHRKIQEQSGTRPLTLTETHQAIAAWLDYHANTPQERGHLQGRTPREVFDAGRGDGLSEAHLLTLRECMLETRKRHADRCQVTLPGNLIGSSDPITYFDQRLYGRKHDVFVRFDPQDLSCVEVYDTDWIHLCTAGLKGKVNAAARILGTEDDQKLLKLSLEMRKHAEKMAGAKAMELLQGEILPGYQENLERIGLVGEAKATLPMAPAPKALPAPELTDAEWAERMDELEELNAEQPEQGEPQEDDFQPYSITAAEQFWMDVRGTWPEEDKYERILEAEAQGMLVPAEHAAFARYFEQTPKYASLEDYFEEFRMKLALMYARPAEAEARP